MLILSEIIADVWYNALLPTIQYKYKFIKLNKKKHTNAISSINLSPHILGRTDNIFYKNVAIEAYLKGKLSAMFIPISSPHKH